MTTLQSAKPRGRLTTSRESTDINSPCRSLCSRSAPRGGRIPSSRKIIAEENTIAIRLVVKSSSAPAAMDALPSAIPIPTLASGGSKAAAIATPGSASPTSLRPIA